MSDDEFINLLTHAEQQVNCIYLLYDHPHGGNANRRQPTKTILKTI